MDFIPGLTEIPIHKWVVIIAAWILVILGFRGGRIPIALQITLCMVAVPFSLLLLFGVDW